MKQTIRLSEGCPHSCPFCFNGKKEFKELPMQRPIKSNNVIIHDDAFLSKRNVLTFIKFLGKTKVNNKCVYYELTQGINVKDLNQDIANALYKNRFKNIRIAWDGSYSKKNMQIVYDGIKYLNNAGYKNKNIMCFILSNYYVSIVECVLKAKIMLKKNIIVCNCVYRKNYLDPKIYPEHWTMKEIELFKEDCRTNNQLIIYDGYDPEIEKRLIRKKDGGTYENNLPSKNNNFASQPSNEGDIIIAKSNKILTDFTSDSSSKDGRTFANAKGN